MEKLDALTPGDEALIPVARDEWLKIGLATGPTDREAAEAAISDAYRMVGLKLPRHWIWLGNPLQGCIGAMMLIEPRIANARAFDPVVANVWKRLANEMGTQGGDPLQDLAGHDVWDRVWYQVLDQMRNQLGVEVRYQNWDRRPDRVWAQISDQVYPLAWRDGGQAADQVRDQVWIQLENQLGVEVRDQVQDQVGDDLGPHLVPKRVSAQHVVQVQFEKLFTVSTTPDGSPFSIFFTASSVPTGLTR
jgi:hypothetical protein